MRREKRERERARYTITETKKSAMLLEMYGCVGASLSSPS
jgi:hypothetical protein